MRKPTEVKVGDLVRITKSELNWNEDGEMDLYVGQIHKVVNIDYTTGTRVYFEGYSPVLSLRIHTIHYWSWVAEDGHFEIVGSKNGTELVVNGRDLIFAESFIKFLNDVKDESRVARIILACRELRYNEAGNLYNQVLTGEEASYMSVRSDGTISYLPKGKECKSTPDGKWAREGRQNGKAGKVIRKIFTEKALKMFKEVDFEVFNNKYKSKCGLGDYVFAIEDDIASVYDREQEDGGCSLAGSCMRGKGDHMGIYQNTKIVTLTNKVTGLLAGRALLWEDVKSVGDSVPESIKFIDRFYVAHDHLHETFKEYAIDNGLWYKQYYKTYDSKQKLINPLTGEVCVVRMTFPTPTDHILYPYIDTFSYGIDGELRNFEADDNIYTYCNVGGGREGDNRGYDQVNECFIDADDLVRLADGRYTNVNGTICTRDGEYYLEEDENVVFCEVDDYHYHVDECVYSDHHGCYIPRSGSYEVAGYYYHSSVVHRM